MSRLPRMLAATACVLALGACSGAHHSTPGTSAAGDGPPTKIFVMGGSATEGDGVPDRLRDAWPYLLYHDAFGRAATLVNGALDGATVAEARALQLPLATEVRPDVVGIWLGADDLLAGTPVGEFRAEFQSLIGAVQATGARRVLVADLPAAFGAAAGAYDGAIRAAVNATHATLVDIEHAPINVVPVGGLAPQPDTAGQRLVADAFARVVARTP